MKCFDNCPNGNHIVVVVVFPSNLFFDKLSFIAVQIVFWNQKETFTHTDELPKNVKLHRKKIKRCMQLANDDDDDDNDEAS